jgi:putative DNA primase/helicase
MRDKKSLVAGNIAETSRTVEPDLDEAKGFLRCLDPDARSFTFQTFDDCEPKDSRLARTLHGTLAEHADTLCDLNRRGAGVCVAVNITDGRGRARPNITSVPALFLDLDGALPEPVHRCPLRPHIRVQTSPGRFHIYWLVSDFDLAKYESTQRAVAKRFDGDPAVASATVCARLPGFFHNKDHPFLVHFRSLGAHEPHSAGDVLAEFPAVTRPHRPSRSGPIVLPEGVPTAAAEAFVQREFAQGGHRCLHFYRGSFYRWCGTHYTTVEDNAVRARLYAFLNKARTTKDEQLVPFKPTATKVNQIFDALKMGVYLDTNLEVPFLVPGQTELPTDLPLRNFIACRNGLLNIDTGELLRHTPAVFNVNALDYDYDSNAPRPERWYRFLEELWPDDEQARDTLQEIAGLLLTADTSFQKIFLLVGPPRSGKGTIGHVFEGLIGRSNVVHPTMASLSTHFGLWPLIDKRLAIIPDARLGRGSQRGIEHLLSISGEDPLTIDRKNQEHWTGRLPTRLLIMSNELPRFPDASRALPSRFVILTLKHSFLHHEQLNLKDKLHLELAGIFNWALEGLKCLHKFRCFENPESSQEAMRQLEDLASPVAAFVRDRCVVGPKYRVPAANLFKEFNRWSEEQGMRLVDQNVFGRCLVAAFPKVRARHSGDNRYYDGIDLRR